MVDIVSPEKRSHMMSSIRGKNTKPELLIRRALHARGFRYRIHDKNLPGKPDLCFPKYKAVVFVHGCFWHSHDCSLFKWPKSNAAFWRDKITANAKRDQKHCQALSNRGWRVLTVWECAVKGQKDQNISMVIDSISHWLRYLDGNWEISKRSLHGC